ncbi:hypothetical protein, partial [Mesorhizobium sp.]|uniref:hypothetical protein n=1 Tax=Mesorhizobium sp. TaxID=1871066 RepID=UPI0025BC0072
MTSTATPITHTPRRIKDDLISPREFPLPTNRPTGVAERRRFSSLYGPPMAFAPCPCRPFQQNLALLRCGMHKR